MAVYLLDLFKHLYKNSIGSIFYNNFMFRTINDALLPQISVFVTPVCYECQKAKSQLH